MKIPFTKYQATGNDYVYIDCLSGENYDFENLSREISRYHYGVGSDGAVFICKSDVADAKMRMFNSDGSEGKNCGNALRCIADYILNSKKNDTARIKIETLSGIKTVTLENDGLYSVDMSECSRYSENDLSMPLDDYPLIVDERVFLVNSVFVGNPHCIVFDIPDDYRKIGKAIENDSLFKNKTNVEFVKIRSNRIDCAVWERGTGETMSCGSGACAVAFLSTKKKYFRANEWIKIKMKGGNLFVKITDDDHAILKGAVEKVFTGIYEQNDI